MIRTEDLTKTFGDFVAVDGVNLNVQAGEVLALLGPNGAGKTTTIRMLTSILVPTRGKAWVAGYDVIDQASEVRASVGVLTENHGLYNRMPALDYLKFYGAIYRVELKERLERIHFLMDEFGLAQDKRRRIGEFSKGMRQKLALVRALLHSPPVLLLDEPTSAMDPESSFLVRDAIRELSSSDRAIIICTHNLSEAEELSDRIAIIQNGKIVVNGTTQELKAELLGPPEYLVKFAHENNFSIQFPEGIELTANGKDWIRYSTEKPEESNPVLVENLVRNGSPIVSIQELPRSLESVYLKVVNHENRRAVDDL